MSAQPHSGQEAEGANWCTGGSHGEPIRTQAYSVAEEHKPPEHPHNGSERCSDLEQSHSPKMQKRVGLLFW